MKQMSRNRIIAMALCLGTVAAVLAYVYLSKQANTSRMVEAVVATRIIPNGTILDSEMFLVRPMNSSELPPRAVSAPAVIVGKVASKDIKAGEAISLDSISEKSRLSQMVKPFMRAVTVALDPVVGVGGFLKPGDHVDVLATFNVNDGTVTKTVLQDVQLIAIGSEIADKVDSEPGQKTKPKIQTNATLAVMPMDAEKLVLADSRGKIRLALRRTDDPSFVSTKGVTGRGIMGKVPSDSPSDTRYSPGPMVVHENTPARKQIMGSQPPLIHLAGMTNKPLAISPPAEIVPVKTVQTIHGTKVEETEVPE